MCGLGNAPCRRRPQCGGLRVVQPTELATRAIKFIRGSTRPIAPPCFGPPIIRWLTTDNTFGCSWASHLSPRMAVLDPERSIAGGKSLALGNCSGLTFAIGRFRIYNNPARGRCRPDIACWAAYLGVIQHASSDYHDVRPAEQLAEQLRTAFVTETAAHYVSAICRADVFIDLACESEAFGFEDRIDRRIARRQVLAVSAPTSARGDRQPIEMEPDRPAKASASNRLQHLEHPSLSRAGIIKPMLTVLTIASRRHPSAAEREMSARHPERSSDRTVAITPSSRPADLASA